MLWSKGHNIHNIEKRWTNSEIGEFQTTIREFSENIFDKALSVNGIDRELALVVSQYASGNKFHKVLYKAACLEANDFHDHRLYIRINAKTGPTGSYYMNQPWKDLLSSNSLFSSFDYTIENDEWNATSTHRVPLLTRLRVAGYKAIIYRIMVKFMKKLPKWFFTKELILPNENELNIEIASSLAIHGVKIKKIQLDSSFDTKDEILDNSFFKLYEAILPIVRNRVEKWVDPLAIEGTIRLFNSGLRQELTQFKQFIKKCELYILKNDRVKRSVLVNAPGNAKGCALSYVCRRHNIPLISSQHGVTIELSKAHSSRHFRFDNSVSDVVFSFNSKLSDVEKSTYFNKSKFYTVGMPSRLMKMSYRKIINKFSYPIAYISTNLYHAGFSLSNNTDYINSIDEKNILLNVLSKLPHKVCYKVYPEDNRRYADLDPVFEYVAKFDNVKLFAKKIDMRYLISNHRIFITTQSTSTLGWPIMSGKPVIFINKKNNYPLTDDAYEKLSKGIFVFNDNDKDFYKNLRGFLSQSLEKIDELWKVKENDRKKMIKEYFSAYDDDGAGRRAAKIILSEYLV